MEFGVDFPPAFLSDHGDMSVTLCRQLCRGRLVSYAGLAGGTDCHCMSKESYMSGLTGVLPSECNIACPSNNQQRCGGFNTTNVYHVGKYLYLISHILQIRLTGNYSKLTIM